MNKLLLTIFCIALLPAAHASEPTGALAQIKKSAVIRLGYLESAPPFSFEETGKAPAGYSVDLCKHVAEAIRKQLGLETLRTEWVPLTLQTRLTAVQARRVDIECGTTTWTLSRQALVDFSLMTFIDGATVLVRSDSQTLRLADMEGKRIAVVPGTTTDPALRGALKRQKISAEVLSVESPDQALELLSARKVDGYASDRLVLLGLGLMAQGASSFRLLDEDFSVEPYALALPRGEPDLRLAVDRALAALYRSGEIDSIFTRWLGPLGKPSMLLSALYYLQSIPE
jgi:glutamate/aspartate transport system substrate-binding protein